MQLSSRGFVSLSKAKVGRRLLQSLPRGLHGKASSSFTTPNPSRLYQRSRTGAIVALFGAAGLVTVSSPEDTSTLKHFGQAVIRCERIGRAVAYDAILYKRTFGAEYASDEERSEAISNCHKKSAERILEALQENGGTCYSLDYCSGWLTPTWFQVFISSLCVISSFASACSYGNVSVEV